MNVFNIARVVVVFVLAILLAGCGAPKIDVGLSSTANLNLGANDQPLPVVVRIYQLSDKGPFESSNFSEIWKNDLAVLGDTLLTKNEIVMNPSSQDRVEFERHAQAKYIGVVAVFRNPVEKKWRAIYSLSDSFLGKRMSTGVNVSLVGSTVKISD